MIRPKFMLIRVYDEKRLWRLIIDGDQINEKQCHFIGHGLLVDRSRRKLAINLLP